MYVTNLQMRQFEMAAMPDDVNEKIHFIEVSIQQYGKAYAMGMGMTSQCRYTP